MGTEIEGTGFLIAAAQTEEDLDRVHRGESVDFWWVRVELDTESDEAARNGGVVLDASRVSATTFAQNYFGVCNPSADEPRGCHLFEEYTFGEENLTGQLSAQVLDGHLVWLQRRQVPLLAPQVM